MLTIATQHLRSYLRPTAREPNPSPGVILGVLAAVGLGGYVVHRYMAKPVVLPPVGPTGPVTPGVIDPPGTVPVAPSDVPTIVLDVQMSADMPAGGDPLITTLDEAVDIKNGKITIWTDTVPVDILVVVHGVVDSNGQAYPNGELYPLQNIKLSPAAELTGGEPGQTMDLMFRVDRFSLLDAPAIEFRTAHKIFTGNNISHGGSAPISIAVKKP